MATLSAFQYDPVFGFAPPAPTAATGAAADTFKFVVSADDDAPAVDDGQRQLSPGSTSSAHSAHSATPLPTPAAAHDPMPMERSASAEPQQSPQHQQQQHQLPQPQQQQQPQPQQQQQYPPVALPPGFALVPMTVQGPNGPMQVLAVQQVSPPPQATPVPTFAAAPSNFMAVSMPDNGPKQLIVNFLDPEVSNADLLQVFAPVGPVEVARIVYDKATNVSKGFGFVYFRSSADAAMAIRTLSGHIMRGRRIKVSYANPQRPAPAQNAYEMMMMAPQHPMHMQIQQQQQLQLQMAQQHQQHQQVPQHYFAPQQLGLQSPSATVVPAAYDHSGALATQQQHLVGFSSSADDIHQQQQQQQQQQQFTPAEMPSYLQSAAR